VIKIDNFTHSIKQKRSTNNILRIFFQQLLMKQLKLVEYEKDIIDTILCITEDKFS